MRRFTGRQGQAGTTLVELLVSLVIIGMALVLVIGTISTGLLNSTLTKRNTAVQAVVQYEVESIGASTFNPSAQPYSDCFATETTTSPTTVAYQAGCPGTDFTLRADMSWQWSTQSGSVQSWQISVVTLPFNTQVGTPLSVYKVAHQ
jgi:Tfp pilus assembly protein PilV